jgi:surfeit locus 1 family protein
VTTLVSVHRGQTQFPPKFILILVLGTLLFSLFAGLGTWQLQRRQWKHQLIARVEQRIHAPPVAPPTQERWPSITAASDEYRHVRITGTLLLHMTTRVQAVTELGSGFWLMTPLRCADGSIILINRGFVPAKPEDYHLPALTSASAAPAPSLSTITGLLRLSEPHGGFLRTNDPANQRWFSRDVGAIAAAHNLVQAAPYFIDAEATTAPKTTDSASPADHPIGGLLLPGMYWR